MTLFGFLLLVLITAIVGSIGQLIGGYSRGGCLVSLLIGFLGAYLGVWLAQQFNLPPIFVIQVDGQPFPLGLGHHRRDDRLGGAGFHVSRQNVSHLLIEIIPAPPSQRPRTLPRTARWRAQRAASRRDL